LSVGFATELLISTFLVITGDISYIQKYPEQVLHTNIVAFVWQERQ
jgi:hypothetical protein